MSNTSLADRYYASIPADDPRFAELRDVLAAVRQTGRHSPAARMLGEWALLGFLLTSGRIRISGDRARQPALSSNLPDPAALLAAKRQVEEKAALIGGFDE